jgi:dTDP-4-dehydrorhamnose reductase
MTTLSMRQATPIGVLVLGGTGMLGHKMFQRLQERFPDTYCTIRVSLYDPSVREIDLLQTGNVFDHCDATDLAGMERFLLEHKPAVVVNCIGIVKQRPAATETVPSILLNALLPHQLAEFCRRWNGRLIHISTDCVFSGARGQYGEEDISDATDLYGRTKYLGEITSGNVLTLRTSIIGRELLHQESLLEWFLRQNNKQVYGYKRAYFSGVTTCELANVVADLIANHSHVCGLYQVASRRISKYELLCLLRDAYRLNTHIVADNEFCCDRSLSGRKLQTATGYVCPSWPELVNQLTEDETPYAQWREAKHEVL